MNTIELRLPGVPLVYSGCALFEFFGASNHEMRHSLHRGGTPRRLRKPEQGTTVGCGSEQVLKLLQHAATIRAGAEDSRGKLPRRVSNRERTKGQVPGGSIQFPETSTGDHQDGFRCNQFGRQWHWHAGVHLAVVGFRQAVWYESDFSGRLQRLGRGSGLQRDCSCRHTLCARTAQEHER